MNLLEELSKNTRSKLEEILVKNSSSLPIYTFFKLYRSLKKTEPIAPFTEKEPVSSKDFLNKMYDLAKFIDYYFYTTEKALDVDSYSFTDGCIFKSIKQMQALPTIQNNPEDIFSIFFHNQLQKLTLLYNATLDNFCICIMGYETDRIMGIPHDKSYLDRAGVVLLMKKEKFLRDLSKNFILDTDKPLTQTH